MSTTNAFNPRSQDPTTGKQQQQGYLDQPHNLAPNAATTTNTTASNADNSMAGTADPSTDYRIQQPQVGGVGDMGTKREDDAARLPAERTHPNSGGTSGAFENSNISDPTNIQQRLSARDPPNPYPEGNAGVGLSSDRQFRNQQPHVGGVGDLGTRSDADVARLPEERADSDPASSTAGNAHPSKDTPIGTAIAFIATRDRERDTTDPTSTQSRGRDHDQKALEAGEAFIIADDPTQHAHTGGITGSNIDTDHGLGMPHHEDTQRRNRDEGVTGQQNWAGATDFQSGRDAGFKADTRDQGVNGRTQAPLGGLDTTSSTRREDMHRDEAAIGHQSFPGATDSPSARDARNIGDTRDRGLGLLKERSQAPVSGVDTTSSTGSGDMHRDAGAAGHQNLPGAIDFQSGRDAGFKADTRDPGVNERTQAPVGGLDTTSSTRREDMHRDEGANSLQKFPGATDISSARDAASTGDTRDRGLDERTQAPLGGVDTTSSTGSGDMHRDAGTAGHQNLAGATDFQSGRDAGHKPDTRDHGETERTQAPLGGVDTSSTRREDVHRDEGHQNLAGATDSQSGRGAGDTADTRDHGLNERTRAPAGGVDTPPTHRENMHRDEGAGIGHQNLAGATDFQSGRDAGHKADTRDHGVNERTQAPLGGVDTTSSTRREDMHRVEGATGHQNLAGASDFQSDRGAGNTADTRAHGADERTQAPVGGHDTTTSTHPGGRDETQEGYDENETTSSTGKSHPGKLDKLHGKVMVALGKLTNDEGALAQGQRLQTEGPTVRPSDSANERRE